MSHWTVFPDTATSKQAGALAEVNVGRRVRVTYDQQQGKHVISVLHVLGPSPTHIKRLLNAVKKVDRFVDPIVVVSPGPGMYWTPNGNHRRAVLEKLKGELIPAIAIPEADVAFQILALNTEKAHNLKEKSLEVIRMYRGLITEDPTAGEEEYAFQFEAPHFITLGLLYETNKRFAGGAFAPILRRVDKFLKGPFPKTLPEREERAGMVRRADEVLGDVVARLKKRGIGHPYVKNFVLEEFDVAKVRYEDVQRAAVVVPPAAE